MSIATLEPVLGTITDNLEEIWAQSEDDIACDRYTVCGNRAAVMVLWERCHKCNAQGGKFYYCLKCFDYFLYDENKGKPFKDGGRWGSCEYCEDGWSQPLSVTTIR